MLIGLAVLFTAFSIVAPPFLTMTNFLNITNTVAILGIVSVGASFVMITGGLDLSVGSQISLACVSCALLMVRFGIHPIFSIVITILLTTVFGLLNGVLSSKFRIHSLLVTLSTMQIIKGFAYIICGGVPIFGFTKAFSVIGQGYLWLIPIPVLVLIFTVLAGNFVLNETYIGSYFYALGGNEEAARLSGINITKIRMLVYSMSGFFAGIAGIILLSRVESGQPSAGTGYEFDVLTAAVLGGVSINGGKGNILGTFIGVLIIGVLSNGLIMMDIGEYYQSVIKGTVLLFAILFDSIKGQKNRY